MTARFTPRALGDLDDIFTFIAKDSPVAARRVRQAILDTADLASRRPRIGLRNARAPELRSLLVRRYQYRVHYELRDGGVWIVHIRHTARRPYEPQEQE